MTFVERMHLIPSLGPLPPQSNRDSITILPSRSGPRAKPHIPDSLLQKRNLEGKLSGTFDIYGRLLYHDARDPQGSFRPMQLNLPPTEFALTGFVRVVMYTDCGYDGNLHVPYE
jgi:hypothetical protein